LGAILGMIGKYAIPLFKKYVLPHAADALRNTASDISSGATIKDAFKNNALSLAKNVGKEVIKRQSGGGMGCTKRIRTTTVSSLLKKPATKKKRRVIKRKTNIKRKRKTPVTKPTVQLCIARSRGYQPRHSMCWCNCFEKHFFAF
jgi:hypothetical protein